MRKLFGKALFVLGFVALLTVSCNNKKTEEFESKQTETESKTSAPVASADNGETKPEGPLPAFQFETTDHDFGTINEGDVVEYTYKFKNVGEAPLIIQGAQGSCGCTVPNWSKDPIPAGGEGIVTAKFNSAGKRDLQNKTVTVTANTYPRQTVLKFKAMVNPKSTDMGPVKK